MTNEERRDQLRDELDKLLQAVGPGTPEDEPPPESPVVRSYVLVATWDDLDTGHKWIGVVTAKGMVSWETLGLLEYAKDMQ